MVEMYKEAGTDCRANTRWFLCVGISDTGWWQRRGWVNTSWKNWLWAEFFFFFNGRAGQEWRKGKMLMYYCSHLLYARKQLSRDNPYIYFHWQFLHPRSTPFHWKTWCTPGVLNTTSLSQNPFHAFTHQINLAVLRGKCCITDAVNVQCMPAFTRDVPRRDNGRGQGELLWGICTELIRGTTRSQLQGPALFATSCCWLHF